MSDIDPDAQTPRRVTYMDPDDFRDYGFLQEVNRLVLHPCGVALEMAPKEWLRNEARSAIRAIVESKPTGTDIDPDELAEAVIDAIGPRTIAVWDDREDPEGTAYGYPIDFRKVLLVRGEAERHEAVRRARFGWHVQPPWSEGYGQPEREIVKAMWAVYEASGPMYEEDGPVSDLDRIDGVFNSEAFMRAVGEGSDPEATYIEVAKQQGYTWEGMDDATES